MILIGNPGRVGVTVPRMRWVGVCPKGTLPKTPRDPYHETTEDREDEPNRVGTQT